MTRKEFMSKLDYYLKDLKYIEKTEIFKFYDEYFDELSIGLDDEVPSSMNPKEIAHQILLDLGLQYIKKKKKMNNPLKFLGVLFLAILGLPVSLPLILTVVILAIVFLFLILLFLFLIPFLIISVPIGILYHTIKYTMVLNNLFITIGAIIFIIGFIYLFFGLMISILKFCLNVVAKIFGYIYSKLRKKKACDDYEDYKFYKEENTYETYTIDKLKRINIESFVGKIIFERANINEIKLSKNIHFKNEDGNVVINTGYEDKIIYYKDLKEIKDIIIVKYKEEILDCNFGNIVAKTNIHLPKKGQIFFKNIVSKATLYVDENLSINVDITNKLGSLSVDDNIEIDKYSPLNVSILNLVGKVKIREVK